MIFSSIFFQTRRYFCIGIRQAGHYIVHPTFFDTLKVHLSCGVHDIYRRSGEKMINVRIYNEGRVCDMFIFFVRFVVDVTASVMLRLKQLFLTYRMINFS